MTICSQCGKWAGANGIFPGQSMQHTCSCRPIVPTPKREWVGLTDDEIDSALGVYDSFGGRLDARKIEAKLKEKNT